MAQPVTENLLPPYLRQSSKVIYSDRGVHGSLYWLNFCQTCKKLVDTKGTVFDIEVLRCSTCSETFAVTENNERGRGCPVCFDCPCCGEPLVIRTALLPPPAGPPKDPEDKSVPEKRFHLVCQSCRWSSRSAGIPDAVRLPSVTSPWRFTPETSSESRDEVAVLADFFRAQTLTLNPPMTTPSKSGLRLKKNLKMPVLADKYKLVSVAKKRLQAKNADEIQVLEAKLPKVVFWEELEEPSEEEVLGYARGEGGKGTEGVGVSLSQGGMLPRNRPLTSRGNWRCATCTHVIVKFDYADPRVVKFKINSSAPLLVPTIQPCQPKLTVGRPSDFIVVITNPLTHDVHMTFSLPPEGEDVPSWVTGSVAKDLRVPGSSVVLLNRACAADEKGPNGTDSLAGEDSSVIAFRKLYNVGLIFSCVPLSAETDTWVSFYIQYDFQEVVATVFSQEKPAEGDAAGSAPTTWISLRIDMNLGRAVNTS